MIKEVAEALGNICYAVAGKQIGVPKKNPAQVKLDWMHKKETLSDANRHLLVMVEAVYLATEDQLRDAYPSEINGREARWYDGMRLRVLEAHGFIERNRDGKWTTGGGYAPFVSSDTGNKTILLKE